MKRPWRWVLLVAAAAMIHRAATAAGQLVLPTDTGTLGLMALNILDGERPLFLHGFAYSGSALAYLIAFSFKLLGVSWVSFIGPVVLLTGIWIVLTYLLVRAMAGPVAGLAAAACFAVPDWFTTWYTLSPDTSYGAFLFLATLVLWLAVRVEQRDAHGPGLWGRCLALGAAAAIGIWTNMLIVPYLCVSAIPVSLHLWRNRLRLSVLLPCVVAGLIAALGFLPAMIQSGGLPAGPTVGWQLSATRLARHAAVLVTDVLPRMLAWKAASARATVPLLLLAAISITGGLCSLLRRCSPPDRSWRLFVMPLLIIVFLVFYLPHEMAAVATPRYVLPIWTACVIFGLAVPCASRRRGLRCLAAAGLALWLGWNGIGSLHAMRDGRHDRAVRLRRRAELVEAVNRSGVRTATLLGSYFFQMEANGLTFLQAMADDRPVRFVSASRERHAASAHAAEAVPKLYVCQEEVVPACRASLRLAGAAWQEHELDGVTLFSSLLPPATARRAVPGRAMQCVDQDGTRSAPANLSDRDHRTALLGRAGAPSSFVIDLGAARPLCGVDLLPAGSMGEDLPTSLALALSPDGTHYTEVVRVTNALPVAHPAGPAFYLGGGHGWIASSFAAVTGRYLRVTGQHGSGGVQSIPFLDADNRPRRLAQEWMLSELVVYEAIAGAAANPEDGLAEMRRYLRESGVRRAACDRWLSPRLQPIAAYPIPEDPTLKIGTGKPPRFLTLVPAPGHAAIVATERADEQQAVLVALFGRRGPWRRVEHGYYTSFLFLPGPPESRPELIWNGQMLVR